MIRVIALGEIDLGEFSEPLGRAAILYNEGVRTESARLSLANSDFDNSRNQYVADLMIRRISSNTKPEKGEKVLAITPEDLYVDGLNFVFGLADPYTRVCIISALRLFSADASLFRARVFKEAAHELGHIFGLHHCPDKKCIMTFANSIADVDLRGTQLCNRCKSTRKTS